MMQPINLIFFDIDNTLMYSKERYMPPHLPRALKTLKEKGIELAIATGRSQGIIPDEIQKLIDDVGISIICTANGQHIQCYEQVLNDAPLPLADIQTMIDYANSHHLAYHLHSATEFNVSEDTPKLRAIVHAVHLNVCPNRHLEVPIYQMGLFIKQDQQDAFEANPPHFTKAYIVQRSGEDYVDIVPRDGCKADAVKKVCAHLGIALDNTAAFGDGYNDMQMLSLVGFGVAMGDAPECVKACAKFITGTTQENGIILGLIHLGLLDNSFLV